MGEILDKIEKHKAMLKFKNALENSIEHSKKIIELTKKIKKEKKMYL